MTGGKAVIILGGGGHSRVVASTARACGYEIMGFVDPAEPARGPAGIPWLGGDEALETVDPAHVLLVNGIGSVGPVTIRRAVHERALSGGFRFATLVHPAAFVADDARLGEGVQCMAGAVVQTGVELAENVVVNSGAVIDHDCRIGRHCHIAPGAVLSGEVMAGEGVHVGTGARIIQGLHIGAGAVVAAGATVVRSVSAGETVAGTPAKPLTERKQKS